MKIPEKLAGSLCLAALSALGIVATQPQPVHAEEPDVRAFDYHQEIFFAVLEGLYLDGVPNEAVDILLATENGWPAHFVKGCPICMPAIDALSVYRARPPFANKAFTDTFGAGLTEEQLGELRSPDRMRRLNTVTTLVERWIERRLRARRLTEAERAAWQNAMEERRKKGMAILARERRRAQDLDQAAPALEMQRCAFCDGCQRGLRGLKSFGLLHPGRREQRLTADADSDTDSPQTAPGVHPLGEGSILSRSGLPRFDRSIPAADSGLSVTESIDPMDAPAEAAADSEANAAKNGAAQELGIPTAAEGTPVLGTRKADFDEGQPVGPTPAMDFWDALYQRRSIRKFKPDPLPRELVDQVMHAGIWAPSSCNYQMWDLVAVDDPETNAKLTRLSSQMGNAPVNIVVSYGRDFSEEQWANIQSASALIQNMSLAAHVLGLGTFWITQMGHREKVREAVGLPLDRLVVAVLALGFPAKTPKSGPKRRPLDTVAHWNHYAGRPIPSTTDPAQWTPEDLTIYQRARVLNGLRHNKPRAWETRALLDALERHVPKVAAGAEPRWLDVLPCTGILTDRLSRERRGYRFDVVERTPDVLNFVCARTRPKAQGFVWPQPTDTAEQAPQPQEGVYDVVSCLFRIENLAPADRPALVADLARWVRPGGRVLIGFVSKRSFHDWTERLRARRGGPKGVEYVLSPDPNIGPFESLDLRTVLKLTSAAGLELVDRHGAQAVPQPEEIEFRTRNFAARSKQIAQLVGKTLAWFERLPGLQSARGRFQFLTLRRPEA